MSRLPNKKETDLFTVVQVSPQDLKPHPRNYRIHPPDQIQHIVESINSFGFYRNVIIAEDNVILAGHGVVQAAQEMGKQIVPAIRLNIPSSDPRALKVLTGDNEISRLAEVNDRQLTELLREVLQEDERGLLGTGFSDEQVAALVLVTRPENEIADKNEAAEWVGMPEYGEAVEPVKLIISFRNDQDRHDFAEKIKLRIGKKEQKTWMTWYPFKAADDLASVKFTG